MREVDELRAQLRHVVEFADAASAKPTPTNAIEAGELVVAVQAAHDAMAVLMAQVRSASKHAPPPTATEARELLTLV